MADPAQIASETMIEALKVQRNRALDSVAIAEGRIAALKAEAAAKAEAHAAEVAKLADEIVRRNEELTILRNNVVPAAKRSRPSRRKVK